VLTPLLAEADHLENDLQGEDDQDEIVEDQEERRVARGQLIVGLRANDRRSSQDAVATSNLSEMQALRDHEQRQIAGRLTSR